MPDSRYPSPQGVVSCLLVVVALIPVGLLGLYALCEARLEPDPLGLCALCRKSLNPGDWARSRVYWTIAALAWAISGLGALVSLVAVSRPRNVLLVSAVVVLLLALYPVGLFFGYFATG
jgi:hypothetical protein